MEFGMRSGGVGFLGLLAIFVVLEAICLRWFRKKDYPWQEAASSFGVAALKRLVDLVTAGAASGILFFAWNNRIQTQEVNGPMVRLGLFPIARIRLLLEPPFTPRNSVDVGNS